MTNTVSAPPLRIWGTVNSISSACLKWTCISAVGGNSKRWMSFSLILVKDVRNDYVRKIRVSVNVRGRKVGKKIRWFGGRNPNQEQRAKPWRAKLESSLRIHYSIQTPILLNRSNLIWPQQHGDFKKLTLFSGYLECSLSHLQLVDFSEYFENIQFFGVRTGV